MQLQSVREIKADIAEWAQVSSRPAIARSAGRRASGEERRPIMSEILLHRPVALGVARRGRRDFKLAIRLQRLSDPAHPAIERMVAMARGEVDLRYTGRVVKEASRLDPTRRVRPLRMGFSVGHHKITAGTIGAFVTLPRGGAAILSNNHVLANENLGRIGDPVLQPGPIDGGTASDQVARLSAFERLLRRRRNLIDAAVAEIEEGNRLNTRAIPGIGRLAGVGQQVDIGEIVRKTGRTTGTREGRVTAIEIDNLVVGYDIGDITFDGQIEIEGTGHRAFSDGGDSGSLIVDAGRQAVGLLFAGSNQGGGNGRGLTYANPIEPVMSKWSLTLLS